MLRRKQPGPTSGHRRGNRATALAPPAMDRRSFLYRSGLTALGISTAAALPWSRVRRSEAQEQPTGQQGIQARKTICPFCAVGCTVIGEVENGVWIGQEPPFESPVNMGTHCAKATFALNAPLWFRRARLAISILLSRGILAAFRQEIHLTPCPDFPGHR